MFNKFPSSLSPAHSPTTLQNSISETDISSQQLLANNKLENSTSFQNIGDAAGQTTTTATIDSTTKTSSISTGNAITPADGDVKQNQHKAQQQPQQEQEQDVEWTKPEDKKTN